MASKKNPLIKSPHNMKLPIMVKLHKFWYPVHKVSRDTTSSKKSKSKKAEEPVGEGHIVGHDNRMLCGKPTEALLELAYQTNNYVYGRYTNKPIGQDFCATCSKIYKGEADYRRWVENSSSSNYKLSEDKQNVKKKSKATRPAKSSRDNNKPNAAKAKKRARDTR